jgi:hypothetical protein
VHLEFYSPAMNPKGHDLVKFYFIKKRKKKKKKKKEKRE